MSPASVFALVAAAILRRAASVAAEGLVMLQVRSEVVSSQSAMDHRPVPSRLGRRGKRRARLVQKRDVVIKPPHIVFILADDVGFNSVGYRPESVALTPFIDELASQGVKLEQYYAYTVCSPSRFSLLTGRDAYRSEAIGTNMHPALPLGTNLDYVMLPAALREAGYATHMVGKWHQGLHMAEYLPTNRGFDSFYGILTGSTDHYSFVNDNEEIMKCKGSFVDLTLNDSPLPLLDTITFGDDRYMRRALRLIKEHNHSAPLFLFLSLQMAHGPYQSPDRYASLYSFERMADNTYHGMLSHMDHTVAMVVSALQEANMYENTLLVFASDNGAPSDAPVSANSPLRGFKGELFDGGMRVPAFVAGGYLPTEAKGRTLRGLVSISDWYATLAHVAGALVDNGGPSRSTSINQWDYLSGKVDMSSRYEIIHHYPRGPSDKAAIRIGNWKMVVGPEPGNHTLCPLSRPCLFNIDLDPKEQNDVGWQNLDIMRAMRRRWESLATESMDVGFYAAWDQPGLLESFVETACQRWASAGGFITPWATQFDEKLLPPRFMPEGFRKMLASTMLG